MSGQNEILAKVAERLRQGGKVLISSHVSPDGDSIGSQLAVYDLCAKCGCDPMIINHDTAFPKYAFLNKHKLINVYDSKTAYPHFDFAVLLEAPELHRIGDVRNVLSKECFVINIDHHPDNGHYGQINYVDESAEAVGIMIFKLFQEAKVPVSADNADELFMTVLTDTGRFRFSNTTPEAMRVCATFLALGASPKKISDGLYACYTGNQLRMLGELIASMELYHDGRTCILLSDQAIRNKYENGTDEIEGLADYSIYTCGVEVGALLREIEPNRTKVSLRSHHNFDVAKVAKVHGGGGHRNAAGCYLNQPIQQAKAALLEQIAEARSS